MRKTILACAVTALAVSGTSATAASFITSAKIQDGAIMNRDIHRGTISENRLDDRVVAKLNRLATPGATGAAGAAGARGATGLKGDKGEAGDPGVTTAGRDGINPATLVASSGDGGWAFSGAPSARLAGGELRLGGGFDGNTVAGGIGMTKAYDNVPLSSLSALSYALHVIKRPNDVSAPTIHVAVTGAATGTASGFMNLVFEPYQNGGTEVGRSSTLDAFTGQWWGTKDTPNHPRQQAGSLQSFVADNPGAKIIAISVDNGGTSGPGTIPAADFDAGVDNLVVGIGAAFDRYDFGG